MKGVDGFCRSIQVDDKLWSLGRSAHLEERRGYRSDIGINGWPTDPRHPANRYGPLER